MHMPLPPSLCDWGTRVRQLGFIHAPIQLRTHPLPRPPAPPHGRREIREDLKHIREVDVTLAKLERVAP